MPINATGLAADSQPVRPIDGEPPASSDDSALMKHLGITVVPKAVYEWGGYRYSSAADAIAAARRGLPE
jgi:hypothetical protein